MNRAMWILLALVAALSLAAIWRDQRGLPRQLDQLQGITLHTGIHRRLHATFKGGYHTFIDVGA